MRIRILLLSLLLCAVPCFFSFKHARGLRRFRKPRETTAIGSIKGPTRYSTSNWAENILSLPSSRILKRTKSSILTVTLWACLLTYVSKVKGVLLTRGLPTWIFSILGSALSLLLVFRTNSAYSRFTEGRTSWSLVLVGCRNIARLAYYLPKEFHPKIASLLVIFCITLKQHLQGERDVSEVDPFFTTTVPSRNIEIARKSSIYYLNKVTNRPLQTLLEIEKTVHEALLESYKKEKTLESDILPKYIEKGFLDAYELLSTQIAVCEKLVKQPVPLSYSRHTSRFLTLYLFSLPFALIPDIGVLTIPITTAICWSFVSIQEIGHFIEEPFNKDLTLISLPQMCAVVCSDVSELLNGIFADNAEIRKLNEFLFMKSVDASRTKDESDFIYYDRS